jgi:hypothetical protein
MRYLLTCICCSFCLSSVAQLSVGARTGATSWFTLENGSQKSYFNHRNPSELRWDKQLYGRYAVKRFSFEVSVNHTKQTSNYFEYLGSAVFQQMPLKYVNVQTTVTEFFRF